MHATRAAPPVRDAAPDVPAALARVIDRCLAKRPDERYATGEALAEALTQALEADRTPVAGSAAARVLSPEAAQAVWLRAAQLQQDAASRIREKTRELEAAGMATASYRLQDVVAAAQEVGIGQEYVQLALTELPSADAPAPALPSDRAERLTTLLLGTTDRSLRVTATIEAAPARVLEALGRIVTMPPYDLQLVDTTGGHPLDGGVIHFHRPLSLSGLTTAAGTVNMFHYRLYQLELEDLRMTLRGVGGDRATEVAVYGDLRPGMRKNVRLSHWVAGGVGGGLGAGVGLLATAKGLVLGVLGGLAVGAPVLAAGAAVSYGLYRLSYRGALAGTEKEIRLMLQAVGGNVRAAQLFGAPPPVPPPAPRAAASDGDFLTFLS
jgi:hypothetical protein